MRLEQGERLESSGVHTIGAVTTRLKVWHSKLIVTQEKGIVIESHIANPNTLAAVTQFGVQETICICVCVPPCSGNEIEIMRLSLQIGRPNERYCALDVPTHRRTCMAVKLAN